jgi:hypothetical protein
MLIGPVQAESLHARGDTLYFWDADNRRIDRISTEGLRGTVVDRADDVTGIVATQDRLVWAGGARNEVLSRTLDGGPITRVAGPLASETPIFLSPAGFVFWSNRAKRGDTASATAPRARPLSPPPSPRGVSFTSADALADKPRVTNADCNQWPAAFVGGPDGQYCCDKKQPVTLVDCKGSNCAYRPLAATCPDVFADDGDRIYFADETRIVMLDRKSGKLDALSKRKRQPRAVTIGGDYVYWLEGEPISDVFRLKKDTQDPASAEMVARRQVEAFALSASDRAVFWVARAPADVAVGSAKHAPSKAAKAAHGVTGSRGPTALYVLVFKGE